MRIQWILIAYILYKFVFCQIIELLHPTCLDSKYIVMQVVDMICFALNRWASWKRMRQSLSDRRTVVYWGVIYFKKVCFGVILWYFPINLMRSRIHSVRSATGDLCMGYTLTFQYQGCIIWFDLLPGHTCGGWCYACWSVRRTFRDCSVGMCGIDMFKINGRWCYVW